MIEVPFDLVNDHVFVRASVNGLLADVIVDTADPRAAGCDRAPA